MGIRFVKDSDSYYLLKIYGQYIDTPITFEYTLPTEEEFLKRISDVAWEYPYLVWEEAGEVVGYAYAHRHRSRAAYQWNAELSIYIDPSFVSKGIGRKLYTALIELLKLQGIKTVYGGVTIPNEKSEKLHSDMGFKVLGTYHNTGYKDGMWHDVRWFEKEIAPYDPEPQQVVPIYKFPREQLMEFINISINKKPSIIVLTVIRD